MEKYNLLAPGPVCVEPKSLEAFGMQPIHHRTPDFETCLKNCRDLLKKVLDTKRVPYTLCSTGSGAMEAAVVNFLNPSDKVLCVVSGKFGERWADMLDAYGVNCIRYDIEWGKSLDVNEIIETLKNDRDIKAVYTQMCETSTGALHPVEELAQAVKSLNPNILVCVDGITGLLTKKLDLDSSGIDVMVSGSQKAFMLPTGLSFIYTSDLAEEKIKEASLPRYYWDLRKEQKAMAKGQTFFSSPVNHFFALEKSLEFIAERGIEKHFQDIEDLATAVRRSITTAGLSVYTEEPAPALTAILLPEAIDGKALRKNIEVNHKVTFMGGQEVLAGKIIRIGHIGYVTLENMEAGLKALYSELNSMGMSIDIETAIKAFYQLP